MTEKTPEQVVAKALVAAWKNMHTNESYGYQNMLAHNAVAALREAGMLVEPEWEYAWEADEEKRAQMNPRGPKYQIDGYADTPENLARFPKGRRVRRVKAGAWMEVPSE